MADRAKPDLRPEPGQRFSKLKRSLFLLFDQVKHQAKSCFFPDAREPGDLINCIFNQFGRKIHGGRN
jgi:hypothetical protein